MRTVQEIIKDTYDNTQKFREQLKAYDLTTEDVGVQFIQSKEHFIGSTDNPLTLGFSMQDEKVIGIFTYLGHEKIEK